MSEEERLVVIRFGRDYDPDCMRQDEVLYRLYPLLWVNLEPKTDAALKESLTVSKTSPSSMFATLIKYQISSKCTSCTTLSLSCSSSETNI